MKIEELISEEQIQKRLTELAKEIDKDYEGKELITICVLRGAIYFMSDLTKKMKTQIMPEFITISSYENKKSTNKITLNQDIRENIKGKDILIIEDIIDTGTSMDFLIKHLKEKEPNSIKICVLLDKKKERKYNIPLDYIGFNVPNKFIVGYGFDIDNKYRNIPYIGYLKED